MKNWREYRLGNFLTRRYDSVQIDDLKKYKRITVRSKGQGIELRDEVVGVDIGTKNQFKIKYNQFLLSKIDALNGAFGIVPEICDGGIITGNFWTYDIDETILLKEYLYLLCLQQVFTKFSLDASEGTTNRKYLREERFLNLTIKLPTIAEQRLIVVKVEEINSRLNQIKGLREEQLREINNLIFSNYKDITELARRLPMKQVAPIYRRQVDIEPQKTYCEIGVRSFGRGLFENPAFKGSDLTWQKPFWMKKGDLLFSNIKAWEGAVGLIPEKYDGWVGSHRYITCLPNLDLIEPEYLYYYFRTLEGVEKLSAASPGTVDRNRTLNNKLLQQIEILVPSIELQKGFVELLAKTDAIKKYHKQVDQEISDLIPALLEKALKGKLSNDTRQAKQIGAQAPIEFISEDRPSIFSDKKEDLELAMIVAIIESKLGIGYGEVGIQKTVFNLEAFYPALSKPYSFVNYHYGTYSAELRDKLKTNPYLIKKKIAANEVYTISPVDKKSILDAIMGGEYAGLVNSVNKVLDIYTMPFINKETEKIELLNTVAKLMTDLKTTDAVVIYQAMKNWEIKQDHFHTKAEKFSLLETRKTVDLLRTLDLSTLLTGQTSIGQ